MSKLSFIDDSKLAEIVTKLVVGYDKIQTEAESNLESNTLDPFSALLFSLCSGDTLENWMTLELNRQIGKSFQNKVGEFHQNILGNCNGCELIDDVIDIRCMNKKVIAEIKNKYNTTKGSDKKSLYDNLEAVLQHPEYKGFTSYYVEIIPPSKLRYDRPFTPSDNVSKGNRPSREDIRVIDGVSFYALITGVPDALKQLYLVLPSVVNEIKGTSIDFSQDPLYLGLYDKTF